MSIRIDDLAPGDFYLMNLDMPDFRDRFIESQGQPILHEGRQVSLSLRFGAASGDTFTVRLRHATDSPIQGLRLIGKKCSLSILDQRGPQFVLWADTAPEYTDVTVVDAKKGAEVVAMNVWRDEKYGSTLQGLNYAGMEVVRCDSGTIELRCSDGWGPPDFSDLVVEIQRAMS